PIEAVERPASEQRAHVDLGPPAARVGVTGEADGVGRWLHLGRLRSRVRVVADAAGRGRRCMRVRLRERLRDVGMTAHARTVALVRELESEFGPMWIVAGRTPPRCD